MKKHMTHDGEHFVWSKRDLREKYGDWYSPESDAVYTQALARVLRSEDLSDDSARIIISAMERLWSEDEMYVTGRVGDPSTTFIDWEQ